MISQATLTQPIEILPFAPRDVMFLTPPNSPIEPHPYLNSLDELPPRSSNLPPPPTQGINQTPPQHSPMDFEPFFPPINLSMSGSRMNAQLEPFMIIMEDLVKISRGGGDEGVLWHRCWLWRGGGEGDEMMVMWHWGWWGDRGGWWHRGGWWPETRQSGAGKMDEGR
ncbi:hypothetical protein Tco_0913444 [Tanacetum coccineum]